MMHWGEKVEGFSRLSPGDDSLPGQEDKFDPTIGSIIGRQVLFEQTYVQPALRENLRACPKQPFPPNSLVEMRFSMGNSKWKSIVALWYSMRMCLILKPWWYLKILIAKIETSSIEGGMIKWNVLVSKTLFPFLSAKKEEHFVGNSAPNFRSSS